MSHAGVKANIDGVGNLRNRRLSTMSRSKPHSGKTPKSSITGSNAVTRQTHVVDAMGDHTEDHVVVSVGRERYECF